MTDKANRHADVISSLWIKCNEEIPAPDHRVLTYHRHEVEIGFLTENMDLSDPKIVKYGPAAKLSWVNDEYIEIDVSHWMPLPKSPV